MKSSGHSTHRNAGEKSHQSVVRRRRIAPPELKGIRQSEEVVEKEELISWDGQITFLFAYDIANEIDVEKVSELCGYPAKPYVMEGTRRSPQYLFFYRMPTAQLESLTIKTPFGEMEAFVIVKALPIGAISLRVNIPFKKLKLFEIAQLKDEIQERLNLREKAYEISLNVSKSLTPYCIGPQRALQYDEPYTVYCLIKPREAPFFDAKKWFDNHRSELASLLADEEPGILSHTEIQERTAKVLQFYIDDLAVIDWDAAILIDTTEGFEEILYVLELANVQWVELEAYDRLLDAALESAYTVVTEVSSSKVKKISANLLSKLREVRIDLAKVRDELTNITRFLGDWYLGRVYGAAATRMQFSHWESTIEEKLRTVHDLYELVQHERTERWMLLLEGSIVGLFILDLIFYVFLK